MHLMCLGGVRSIVLLWVKSQRVSFVRLSALQVNLISDIMAAVRKFIPREFVGKFIPREFAQKPRPLTNLK